MADRLLAKIRADVRAATPGAGLSHISHDPGSSGKSKPLSDQAFPTNPTFPTPETDVHSGSNFREISVDPEPAELRARARGVCEVGNVGNVGNPNAVSDIPSISISHKEEKSGKSGKSSAPSALIVPGLSREDILSLFEERAAIREFDAGMTRAEAQAAATADVRQAIREGRIDPSVIGAPLF